MSETARIARLLAQTFEGSAYYVLRAVGAGRPGGCRREHCGAHAAVGRHGVYHAGQIALLQRGA